MNPEPPMAPGWSVVTGANRGIGLEFTRQLLMRSGSVAACCRKPAEAEALHVLKSQYNERLALLSLDLSSEESIRGCAAEVGELSGGVALLLHNAGMFARGETEMESFAPEEMRRVFETNLVGPLTLTRELHSAIARGGKVFFLTSRTGVLRCLAGEPSAKGQFSYPCSKAAVHRSVPVLAGKLFADGIVVGGIDPGWVRTDMTSGAERGDRFLLEPAESVAGMLTVMDRAGPATSGTLWRWNGEVSRWYAPEETAAERQEVTK